MMQPMTEAPEGILLVDKPEGKTSFHLVKELRHRLKVKKIGHAGTLDPLATGVMVMLIGRNYTRLSDQFLLSDKEYLAEIALGSATDTYDAEGTVIATSPLEPTLEQVKAALALFSGSIQQVPPMYSARKINGQKLYDLARQGKEVERPPIAIHTEITLVDYTFPKLTIRVSCSKGTYIRTLADDIGKTLGCYGHIQALRRLRSGHFHIDQCLPFDHIKDPAFDLLACLQKDLLSST
ncbi:MAG: tRNA pseudouridine synthase [Chlamydiales bacterium]|jgi:tRNA pseudouridine55 synthase|nr:tRNA pseudouridine synthase [Chlamydiales bacterium]